MDHACICFLSKFPEFSPRVSPNLVCTGRCTMTFVGAGIREYHAMTFFAQRLGRSARSIGSRAVTEPVSANTALLLLQCLFFMRVRSADN